MGQPELPILYCHNIIDGGPLKAPGTVLYQSVKILLPVFIAQLAILRQRAAYVPTTRIIQGNLYLLESALETALAAKSVELSVICLEWIELSGSIFSERYYLNFIQSVAYDYIHLHKGKKRLKELPVY